MKCMSDSPDKSIWLTSGSRSNAKAVYRMLGNEKCDKESILKARRVVIGVRAESAVMLAIQDTMSVNYDTRKKTEGLGYKCEKKTFGINVHSTLGLSLEGIPMGVFAQSINTRKDKEDSRTKEQRKRVR